MRSAWPSWALTCSAWTSTTARSRSWPPARCHSTSRAWSRCCAGASTRVDCGSPRRTPRWRPSPMCTSSASARRRRTASTPPTSCARTGWSSGWPRRRRRRPCGRSTPRPSRPGRVVSCDFATAELVKVAANAFLATKISFINAMAEVCEATGADVIALSKALSYDDRIGGRFLHAGLGFGGGCLPKDIRAFMARAGELGVDQALSFLKEVDAINMRRRARMVDLAAELVGGSFGGMKVAVLGAAFKPNSDDIRDSAALDVAATIQRRGAAVAVYDPMAMEQARVKYPQLGYRDCALSAVKGADLVLHLTEWPEFRDADPAALGEVVAECRRVGVSELRPLGQVQHQVGTLDRRQCAVAVAQLRVLHPGLLHGHRVVDRHRGAPALDRGGNIERRAVPDVIGVGLERRPEDGDLHPTEGPANQLGREVNHARPAAHIDRVDLLEERQRLVDAELAGPGHERPDVLGQAPTAETETGVQEAPTDPVVVRQRLGQRDHVRPGRLADFGHGVMALMKLIFVARKALAATLTSSAVAKPQLTTGVPADMAEA